MKIRKLSLRSQAWRRKALLVFIAVVFAALLVGCSTMTYDVTFYSGQRWKAKVDIMLTPQQLAMAGGRQGVEAEIERRKRQYEQRGIEYKMKEVEENGNVIYRLSIAGEGWDTLTQAVFNGQAQITSGDGAGEVSFLYYPISVDVVNLSLTGGRILSSNADEVRGNTATWYNVTATGRAEAVLTEAASGLFADFDVDIPVWVGIGLAGLVLIGVLFSYISKQSKQLA